MASTQIIEYPHFYDYLFDQLQLLDLRLLRLLEHEKTRSEQTLNPKKGPFFITHEEMVFLLELKRDNDFSDKPNPEIESIDNLILDLEQRITHRLQHTKQLAIFSLINRFGLSDIEISIMMMAIAPEIDRKYERIYAYFNDDLTQKKPSIGLTLNLFYENTAKRLDHYPLFYKDSPLLFLGLIHVIDAHQEDGYLSQRYQIDNGIKAFLLGDGLMNPEVSRLARFFGQKDTPESLNNAQDLTHQIQGAINHWLLNKVGYSLFWLYGKGHDLKETLILAMSSAFQRPIITADLEDILYESNPDELFKLMLREAVLFGAFLFLKQGDFFYGIEEKEKRLKMAFMKSIRAIPWMIFISADNAWMPEDSESTGQWYPLEVGLPDYTSRNKLWNHVLRDTDISATDINTLAGRFNFNEAQILRAVNYARDIHGEGHLITLESLYKGCNLKPFSGLDRYSTQIKSHYQWDDLVLPEAPLMHLQEIGNFIINRHIVYYQWGFEKKLSLSRGVNILFSGSSGTGKTMSASLIANEVKLALYRVNLSSIVSKYIGETEKNLEKIFNDANAGNVILFFDEADALFGKRSEVKDAHDRYANIEINYLLQKMEVHEGIVILATNLNKNIDDAFLRRMHFTVEFPFPDEAQREGLWQKIFPENVPLSKDINYQVLGEKLHLSGGNIKNIALTAAFYGTKDSSEVTMAHIIKAAEREYHKMGKTFVKSGLVKITNQ